MRIRTIKPEFYLHEGLFELEQETGLPVRLAFTGLWCVADREGRFKWNPRKIGVQVMPYDQIDFSRVLDALATRGFILKYVCDSVEYGCIPSFKRHQVINNRERPSELPEPLESRVIDASLTREPRVSHAGKAEGKGKEGNMEGKGKDLLSDAGREVAESYPPELEQLWGAFPSKSRERSSKKLLNDQWRKAKGRPPWEEVSEKIKGWSESHDWTKDGGQFAPGAHLWIRDRKWECEIPSRSKPSTPSHRTNSYDEHPELPD